MAYQRELDWLGILDTDNSLILGINLHEIDVEVCSQKLQERRGIPGNSKKSKRAGHILLTLSMASKAKSILICNARKIVSLSCEQKFTLLMHDNFFS